MENTTTTSPRTARQNDALQKWGIAASYLIATAKYLHSELSGSVTDSDQQDEMEEVLGAILYDVKRCKAALDEVRRLFPESTTN